MDKLNVWNVSWGHEGYSNGVSGWQAYRPNSAGGVSVKWSFKNNTEKTIKYASFWFEPRNAVNDAVRCTVKGKSLDGVKYTGPLSPGGISKNIYWENAWYNSSISSVWLSHVYVEYMDGTSERIELSEISRSKPEGAGCYIATAVYGSYDCPEVWTLRRYRDTTLAGTWYGRTFVKLYYAISPTLVKWFGNTKWFKSLWKGKLDRMVTRLQSKGVESTPYEDKNW